MIRQHVKNYALALFSLCKENGISVTDINDELCSVNKIFENEPEFSQLLYSPVLSRSEKTGMLNEVFSGKISDIVLDFLCVVVDNSRIEDFYEICLQFKELYHEDADILEVTVTTTVELSETLRTKLKIKLEKLTGKNVILQEKTDKNLIGGIIVDYNDTQIDASLKTKLSGLKKSVDDVIA